MAPPLRGPCVSLITYIVFVACERLAVCVLRRCAVSPESAMRETASGLAFFVFEPYGFISSTYGQLYDAGPMT